MSEDKFFKTRISSGLPDTYYMRALKSAIQATFHARAMGKATIVYAIGTY